MRGRKPVPTHILELRGSWLAKKRPDAGGVLPPIGPPPSWILPEALPYWAAIVGQAQYLTTLDATLTAVTAETILLYVDYRQNREGKRISPSNLVKLWGMVLKGCQELGLTPLARTRIPGLQRPAPPATDKDVRRFFADGGKGS